MRKMTCQVYLSTNSWSKSRALQRLSEKVFFFFKFGLCSLTRRKHQGLARTPDRHGFQSVAALEQVHLSSQNFQHTTGRQQNLSRLARLNVCIFVISVCANLRVGGEQLGVCCQAVCCDRQFFPVAICCTFLHRENMSFEVLCSHFVARMRTVNCSPPAFDHVRATAVRSMSRTTWRPLTFAGSPVLPTLRLSGGIATPTWRYHGRMLIHPSPPACGTSQSKVFAHTQVRDPRESAAACSALVLGTPTPWHAGYVGQSTAYWFSILKISRIIHTINFIL